MTQGICDVDKVSLFKDRLKNIEIMQRTNSNSYYWIGLGDLTTTTILWDNVVTLSGKAGEIPKIVEGSPLKITRKDCNVVAGETKIKLEDFGITVIEVESYPEVITSEPEDKYESEKELVNLSSENFYIHYVYSLPNVKAIVCEIINGIKFLTTILCERDLEARKEIYRIEMKMFDSYPNEQFNFSTNYYVHPKELDLLIAKKKILFYKR